MLLISIINTNAYLCPKTQCSCGIEFSVSEKGHLVWDFDSDHAHWFSIMVSWETYIYGWYNSVQLKTHAKSLNSQTLPHVLNYAVVLWFLMGFSHQQVQYHLCPIADHISAYWLMNYRYIKDSNYPALKIKRSTFNGLPQIKLTKFITMKEGTIYTMNWANTLETNPR